MESGTIALGFTYKGNTAQISAWQIIEIYDVYSIMRTHVYTHRYVQVVV